MALFGKAAVRHHDKLRRMSLVLHMTALAVFILFKMRVAKRQEPVDEVL